MDTTNFPESIRSFADRFVSPLILWTAFGVALVIFAAISAILLYHWKSYAIDLVRINRVVVIYFTVAGSLFAVMLISLMYYMQ